MKNQIEILLSNNAKMPEKATQHYAGYDLFSYENTSIEPFSRKCVSTGIKLKSLDIGHYIRIAPRSGLSVKKSIDVGAGVIDNDYRGEIKVVLINNSNYKFHILSGDKIAQFIVEKYKHNTILNCYNEDNILCNTEEISILERGEGGFGSSGI